MKRGVIWIALTCLMVTSLVLASCNNTSTATTSTSTTTNTSTSTTTKITTTTTTAPPTTTTSTTAVTGNWWDKLGTPQYGDTMTIRINANIANFDPDNSPSLENISEGWFETLTADDWTLDPSVFAYNISFRPNQYATGHLASSWEMTDASTYLVHLRQGIHWQSIPPANGREFTADDVVFHYDRLFGLGDGFTKPSAYYGTVATWKSLTSVTATDKYTVVFKWSTNNPELIMENMQSTSPSGDIENPDALALWGNLDDWHHAIGTGPFILQDFVSGSSATLIRNPNYWGHDERYPQNQLPYVNTLKIIIIPDAATALSGLRSGKIDELDGISLQDANSIKKTKPEILQLGIPAAHGLDVDPRNDVKPFNDVKVREALQMAIDLPTIAQTYYVGTADPYPDAMTSYYETGYGFPYAQWPQDLKDQYTYNPTAAKKLLADAGYPNGFKTDVVADNTADLDLLQIVKSYFSNIGVDMSINTMDHASWVAFVSSSHKHDQMSYSALGVIGLTYAPTLQLALYLTGNSTNYMMVNDPVYNAFYTKGMTATTVDEINQALKDANQYAAQQHFVISLLQPNLFAIYWPWLKGFNGQNQGISGTNGPQFLFFYGARFWIDQNLKKSMGY